MVMPLKLAGILMKYMQLQGAQCPPASGVLIKPPVFSAAGALLRETCLFPASSATGLLWGRVGRGRASRREARPSTRCSLLCAKTGWSGACTCTFGAGRDLPARGARRVFVRQTVAQGFDNGSCFSGRRWRTARSRDLKASRNPAKPQRASNGPLLLPRLQYS